MDPFIYLPLIGSLRKNNFIDDDIKKFSNKLDGLVNSKNTAKTTQELQNISQKIFDKLNENSDYLAAHLNNRDLDIYTNKIINLKQKLAFNSKIDNTSEINENLGKSLLKISSIKDLRITKQERIANDFQYRKEIEQLQRGKKGKPLLENHFFPQNIPKKTNLNLTEEDKNKLAEFWKQKLPKNQAQNTNKNKIEESLKNPNSNLDNVDNTIPGKADSPQPKEEEDV